MKDKIVFYPNADVPQTGASGGGKWKLSFKDTSLFQYRHLNYHTEKPVLSRELDNWLFEEFLPVDDATLSFEVTFSSGGSLLIHFPDGSVSIEK